MSTVMAAWWWMLVVNNFTTPEFPFEKSLLDQYRLPITPMKTNMSPENQWLEDVFPTEIVTF